MFVAKTTTPMHFMLLLVGLLTVTTACGSTENDPADDTNKATEDNRLKLVATLSPPNQNGTHPDYSTDPGGVVPSDATGTFSAYLNLETNTLEEIKLDVEGMTPDDLKGFGPNSTQFHIHLPKDGKQGAFGFNVVDLVHGADDGAIMATDKGFSFTRASHSILGAAQGNYTNAGVHPGDDKIADLLQNGYPFVLVHSSKDIFTNDMAKLPSGDPAPKGFPFGELRGEITIKK